MNTNKCQGPDDDKDPPHLVGIHITYPNRYTTASGPAIPTLIFGKQHTYGIPHWEEAYTRRHVPCAYFRQRGGCANGDACTFAHHPFLKMSEEYIETEGRRGRDPPEILPADPNVLMENAIEQRRHGFTMV